MTAIAVGSVRSGGATTLAMTLAGVLDDAVLVEADADGGVLALRYGLSREPGLVSLAASRQPPDVILDHAQRLPGGMAVVVGPESPERASQLLRSASQRIAGLLAGASSIDLVFDLGRLSPSSPGTVLAAGAQVALVVARPRAEELVAAAERVAALGEGAGLVLIGSGPYSATEVTNQLGCRVVGTIADDPRGARALAEGGSARTLARSGLVRSVRTLAAGLLHGSDPTAEASAGTLDRAGLPA